MNEGNFVAGETGAVKDEKLGRPDLIPPEVLLALAEHYGRGARKYEDRNWERGSKWSIFYGALQRHLWRWWGGQDYDDDPLLVEAGELVHELDAVIWQAVALRHHVIHHPDLDDRPNKETS